MDITDLGEVIATRKLSVAGDQKREVTVLIGKPKKVPAHHAYYCPYQIVGVGTEKVRYAAGVDAVHAIQLTMLKIGARLYTLKEASRLRWEGESDLGFPAPGVKS